MSINNNNSMQQQQQQHNNSNYLVRGRKRRNSEDEDMEESPSYPKQYLQRRSSKCIKLGDMKRHKSGVQKRSTRGALLDTMDKDALINILNSVLIKQPQLKYDIINNIPAPTISSSLSVLVDLEKKFMNSFPFNKNGPGRDDYTFSRVRENLTDLIDTINQYASHFTTSTQVFPSTYFTFLDHATHMAHRLPNWDNDSNNLLKKTLYQDLNEFWKLAIQTTSSNLQQGECYSAESVSDWAKSLAQHNSFTNGFYFTEAVHEFTRQLGYMIGLPNTAEHENTSMMSANTPQTTATTPICHLTPLTTSLTSTSIVGDRR